MSVICNIVMLFFTEQDVQTKKPMGAAKTTEKKVESSSEDSSDEGIVK